MPNLPYNLRNYRNRMRVLKQILGLVLLALKLLKTVIDLVRLG